MVVNQAPVSEPADVDRLPAIPTSSTPPAGLTSAEVEARRAAGQGNESQANSGSTYGEIVRRNLLTFINVTLVGIGLVLIALGQPRDAVLTSSLAIITAIIGIVQEVRAKRRLDQIALLNRVGIAVRRDGEERQIEPEELVVGDLVLLRPGSQVPLDGTVFDSDRLSIDESLLTGEADHIAKKVGDPLYSGSFCVSGQGCLEVEKVGAASLAASITAGARARKATLTPLQLEVNRIVRVLIVVAAALLVLLMIQAVVFWHASFRDSVTAAAVILGIVPPGLFLMITVTYSMAAVRLASQNALVQQTNAIESLSNVNVFCMDKTGTLTSNRLELANMDVIGNAAPPDVERWLGSFAASMPGGTKSSEAIAAKYPAEPVRVLHAVPFASSIRWSGMVTDAEGRAGTLVLGAPEALMPALAGDIGEPPAEWKSAGLRVLLFAVSDDQLKLEGPDGEPSLPDGLRGVAWIALKDELRPHLQETLKHFGEAKVRLKIISGDNPDTVAALALQAGFPADATSISGDELERLEGQQFDKAVAATTIFGRIAPQLKERIVDSLKRQGAYVAMTGDGVNDVLSLKKAHLGIAMESGSEATRAVADIVLLRDSFSALPHAFKEGQRIRRGLHGTLDLFLTRVFAVAVIMALTAAFRLSFPFLPGHMTLLTLLTVGIPTFALALFAPPGRVTSQTVRSLVRFVLPSVIFVSSASFTMYAIVYVFHDLNLREFSAREIVSSFLYSDSEVLARDGLTFVLVLCGLWLVVFAAPPTKWFAVVEETTHDWRPTIVAIAMVPLYAIIMGTPGIRGFFGMNPLEAWLYAPVALAVTAWMIGLRYVWASGFVDRMLDSAESSRVVASLRRQIRSLRSRITMPMIQRET